MSSPGPFSTYNTTDTSLNHGTIFRIRDIEEQVQWRNKNGAEFYKFLREMRRGADATQVRHEWGERDKAPNYLIVKADCNSSATSIDVFDAYQAVTGETFYNTRTGEIIRIDAVDDADTISTAATAGYGRGHMNSTAAAMVIGDRLRKMGIQLAEEGTAANVRTNAPTPHWNYCQAFQKTWSSTRMQESAKMLDGVGGIDEAWMRSMWEMDEDVNSALYFSIRAREVEADGNLYSMNGFYQQVRTHAIDFSNIIIPSWELFNETFSPLFDANASSDSKTVYCGKGAYSSIVLAARAAGLKLENMETLWGTEVTQINVDGGTLYIVKDYRTLRGPILSGSGIVVDDAHVEIRPYDGWDRVVFTNVQANDQPTVRKDMAMEMMTLVVHHEDTCAKFEGLSDKFENLK